MKEADEFLLEFHERNPGCTRVAFASGQCIGTKASSYDLLSSLARDHRVLDLGCGDGHLLSLLQTRDLQAIGLDFSRDELRAAKRRDPGVRVVRGNAQNLPFADGSFSLLVSHFAFHLMSNLDAVVDEIARVLIPGGQFAAIVGGGPKLGDPFELFLDILRSVQRDEHKVPPIGERRGRTDAGLKSLFGRSPDFDGGLSIEDFYVDFGGTFEEVWARLSTTYDLMHFTESELANLRERFFRELGSIADAPIPCTMAIRRVIAQRAWR